jgi:hypothetical protein
MAWLLLVTKEDDGEWKPLEKPFPTKEQAEAEGERLKTTDLTIRNYRVQQAQ